MTLILEMFNIKRGLFLLTIKLQKHKTKSLHFIVYE